MMDGWMDGQAESNMSPQCIIRMSDDTMISRVCSNKDNKTALVKDKEISKAHFLLSTQTHYVRSPDKPAYLIFYLFCSNITEL